MTTPLLLHWVKTGAAHLESLSTLFPQPSSLHSKLLKVPQSPVISPSTKQKLEAKNTNHITV